MADDEIFENSELRKRIELADFKYDRNDPDKLICKLYGGLIETQRRFFLLTRNGEDYETLENATLAFAKYLDNERYLIDFKTLLYVISFLDAIDQLGKIN
jgi:hypothetical protein